MYQCIHVNTLSVFMLNATQLAEQHAAKLLISRLDYCNTLLAGLPSCAINSPQMIQNAAARLVFNEPKRAQVYFSALANSYGLHQVQNIDVCT